MTNKIKGLTVGQLREILKDFSDDTLVVTDASDHEYLTVRVQKITALISDKYNFLYQDHGDENKLDEKDKRIPVLYVE